ncbi:unnamed protein product [Somion occarium]
MQSTLSSASPHMITRSLSDFELPRLSLLAQNSSKSLEGFRSSLPCPSLPIEVWEYVLDELYQAFLPKYFKSERQWMKTLCACCLTCRAWLPHARYHLYNKLILESRRRTHSLVQSLQIHGPDNARLIQHLTLNLCRGAQEFAPLLLIRYPNLTHLTLLNLRVPKLHVQFFKIIRLLTSVQSLCVMANQITVTQLIRLVQSFDRVARLTVTIYYHKPSSYRPIPSRTKPLLNSLQLSDLYGQSASFISWLAIHTHTPRTLQKLHLKLQYITEELIQV